jgi:all-trans-retinol 13,14-reductase
MFGPGEPFTRLCERLGIMSRIEVRKHGKIAGDYLYLINPEFKFEFRNNLSNLTKQLIELFPEDRNAILQFLRSIKDFLDTIKNAFYHTVTNPTSFFKDPNQSLAQFLKENFKSSRLQTILCSHAMLYGSLPEETPLDYHATVSGGYYEQSWRVLNGGYAIAKAFEMQLQKNDISVFTNSPIDKIHINSHKTVKAITLEDGEYIECDNCIFTAHPRLLTSVLPPGIFRPVYQSRLQNLKDTLSAVVLFCKSEKADLGPELNNIILVHKPFPDMFVQGENFGNRFMYISRSISDKYVGGISIICPWRYEDLQQWEISTTSKRSSTYYAWKEKVGDAIISVVRKYCEGKLGHLKIIDIATPLTFRDYMNSPNGCLYGVKHRTVDMPFMPKTRIKGLYLSGQAIISAGIMGAMIAGFISSAAITGEDYSKVMHE